MTRHFPHHGLARRLRYDAWADVWTASITVRRHKIISQGRTPREAWAALRTEVRLWRRCNRLRERILALGEKYLGWSRSGRLRLDTLSALVAGSRTRSVK